MGRALNEALAFRETVFRRRKAVYDGCVTDVTTSMLYGSPETGAPGQRVDQGILLGSFQPDRPGEWEYVLASNAEHAPANEEGIQEPYTTASGKLVTPKAFTQKSAVGGSHSRSLTVAAWDRVVQKNVNIAKGSG